MGKRTGIKFCSMFLIILTLFTACKTLDGAPVEASSREADGFKATTDRPSQAGKLAAQSYSLPESFQSIRMDWRLVDIDNYVAAGGINCSENLKALRPVPGELPKGATPIRTYQVASISTELQHTARYTYTFYPDGILEVTDRPTQRFSQSAYYTVDKAQYEVFLQGLDKEKNGVEYWYPCWPLYAVAQNVETITYTSADGKSSTLLNKPMDERLTRWRNIEYLGSVKTKSVKTVKKDAMIQDATCIALQYSTGALIRIWQNEDQTLVTASNMDYAVLYESSASRKRILYLLDRLSRDMPFPMDT